MAVAIWKDKFSNLGAVASSYFRIRVSGSTIYQGRAYRAASSGNLYVRINDICANYMSQKPATVPITTPSAFTFPVSFQVQKSSDGNTWSSVETVSFNDDWSYDDSFDPSTMGMSFPITGRVDIRQMIYQTRYASGSVNASCNYEGTARTIATTGAVTGQHAYIISLNHAGATWVSFDCDYYKTYSGKKLTTVTIGLVTYKVVDNCNRYVLYYKNPFGGYDSLLLEGRCWKNGAVSQDTFKADYDNTKKTRETWDFQNEITESYTMNTGILTEDESARMPYLLNSPDVFLCDLNASSPNLLTPCVIGTTSYQVKTKGGREMINYTFDVKVAQNKYAR